MLGKNVQQLCVCVWGGGRIRKSFLEEVTDIQQVITIVMNVMEQSCGNARKNHLT